MPTSRGRELANDPVGLWWHVAVHLPFGGGDASDAEWQAEVLLLADRPLVVAFTCDGQLRRRYDENGCGHLNGVVRPG